MKLGVTRTAPDIVEQQQWRFDQWSAVWIGVAMVIAVLIVGAVVLGDWFAPTHHPHPQASVIPQPRVPADTPVPATPSTLP